MTNLSLVVCWNHRPFPLAPAGPLSFCSWHGVFSCCFRQLPFFQGPCDPYCKGSCCQALKSIHHRLMLEKNKYGMVNFEQNDTSNDLIYLTFSIQDKHQPMRGHKKKTYFKGLPPLPKTCSRKLPLSLFLR